MPYHEADLGRVRTVPVGTRRNKVDSNLLATPPGDDRSFAAFLDSLPDVLAARDLRAVIAGVAQARRAGRAVVLPEVFLKALTVARILADGRPTHFLAADFDMQRHYRPRVNVVQRPTRGGGQGYLLTGHHELLLPLLFWGVSRELDR
jgi:hypothetical protein